VTPGILGAPAIVSESPGPESGRIALVGEAEGETDATAARGCGMTAGVDDAITFGTPDVVGAAVEAIAARAFGAGPTGAVGVFAAVGTAAVAAVTDTVGTAVCERDGGMSAAAGVAAAASARGAPKSGAPNTSATDMRPLAVRVPKPRIIPNFPSLR